MAPSPSAETPGEHRGSAQELETVSDITASTVPADPCVDKIENEMAYLREAVQQILRNQIYGTAREGRDSTPPGFSSPPSGVQFQGPPSPVTLGEPRNRSVAGLTFQGPLSPATTGEPRIREGILSSPSFPPATQLKQPEFRLAALIHETRVESPGLTRDITNKTWDLPMYEGRNPEDWLFRVEKCFAMNHTPENEKLDRALACLTGPAVTWWRISQERERILG